MSTERFILVAKSHLTRTYIYGCTTHLSLSESGSRTGEVGRTMTMEYLFFCCEESEHFLGGKTRHISRWEDQDIMSRLAPGGRRFGKDILPRLPSTTTTWLHVFLYTMSVYYNLYLTCCKYYIEILHMQTLPSLQTRFL